MVGHRRHSVNRHKCPQSVAVMVFGMTEGLVNGAEKDLFNAAENKNAVCLNLDREDLRGGHHRYHLVFPSILPFVF